MKKDLRIYVSQEDKEPKEGRCEASYFSENVFFVHTHNKQAKTFENSNIYISFLSIKGCSITIRVKFLDPKGGYKKSRLDNDMDEKVVAETNIEGAVNEETMSDPFKKLHAKMREEQKKLRKFKHKMQQ